jgi:hypothetical protein
VVQQLTPGDHATGIVHQLPQNHELFMWQMNRGTADKEPVPIKMQLHVTNSQDP